MIYRLDFTKRAVEDIEYHKKVGDRALLKKIGILLEELTKHPFKGSGKLEPLKHALSGCWSRRINREHRLVYEILENVVVVLYAKGHYN